MKYAVVSKLGSNLTLDEIAACTLAINEGGALEDSQTARRELSHAIAVAILHCGGNIVGVGAIKRARPGYAKSIAGTNKSGLWIKSK
jgi:hypothetical protein